MAAGGQGPRHDAPPGLAAVFEETGLRAPLSMIVLRRRLRGSLRWADRAMRATCMSGAAAAIRPIDRVSHRDTMLWPGAARRADYVRGAISQ